MDFGDTITVERDTPAGTDPETKDPIPGTTITFDVPGCALAPFGQGNTSTSSMETFTDGRDITTTSRTLYAPHGTDIRHRDRVVHQGKRYEVDGDAWQATSPLSGWMAGMIASLKRIEGPGV